METTTVRIEFIKEAHASACQTWKSKIEKEFPDVFKTQLEIGKWYFVNREKYEELKSEALVFFQGHGKETYGFNHANEYTAEYGGTKTFSNPNYTYRLAEQSEIESALIAEAKRRGLVKGVKVSRFDNFYYGSSNKLILSDKYHFGIELGRLTNQDSSGYWSLLFENGKWATIISEPTEKELLQQQLNELQEKINKLM